ncbi:MAG: glycosyltransferase family 9 protein [Bacteroidota bacterium]
MYHLAAKILTRWLLFLQQKRPSGPFDPSQITSILLVEFSRLGDVVTMFPVIESFRSSFPQAKIAVAVDRRYQELFNMLPAVNSVYSFDRTNSLSGFFEARRALRAGHFDLVCSMSPSARNSLLTLGTRSSAKVGYFDVHDSMTPFLNHSKVHGIGVELAVSEQYHLENIGDRAAKVCRALGIPFAGTVRFEIPPETRTKVRDFLARFGYGETQLLVVVHAFAGWEYRQWQLSQYAVVAQEMVERHSACVVFIGTQKESCKMQEYRKAFPQIGAIPFFDSSDTGALTALLARAGLFIGNDSGPLHLASAMGVPTVGLFGPASPSLTGPQTHQDIGLFHRVECSPCNQIKCVRPDDPCINLIAAEEVLGAVETILAGLAPIGRP